MTDKTKNYTNNDTSSVAHHMGQQFLFAFAILISISLGSFVFTRYHTSFEEATGALINISGQQRMLTQRIGLLSAVFVTTSDVSERQVIKDEILTLIRRFERHHKGLTLGDHSLNLSALSRPEVIAIYYSAPYHLDEQVNNFIQHTYKLTANSELQLELITQESEYIKTKALSQQLLSGLELVVTENEAMLAEQIQRLKWVNTLVLISHILGFLFVGIFLSRPLLRRIKKQFSEAVEQNEILESEIINRKKIEHEKEKLAIAVEQLAETIVITDAIGIIEYVNPTFEKLSGFSKEDAIGQNMRILKSGEHESEFYQSLWDTISNKKIWKGTIINRKKNGDLFEEITTISPILNEQNEICNFVAVKSDISRIRELEKQLLQSQKLQAVGTMAGGIAHDFNNILASILGYSELLKNRMSDKKSKEYEYLDIISYSGNRAKDLVQQILLFSRQTEPEKKPVQLEVIVEEALKLIRSTLPSTISINFDYQGEMTISGDETQLNQVIMNLCINAFHAMPDGGDLKISLTKNIYFSANEFPEMDHQKEYTCLSIKDKGTGMSAETIEHLFDPFFSTKEPGKGTGLGMSVVLGIVESHDGSIQVDSELGKGTAVNVYFPSIDLSESLPEDDIEDLSDGGSEHIVVVDDEPLILKYVATLLVRKGYRVTEFINSRDALEFCMQNTKSIDLMITDYTMPNMTGVELAKELKQKNINIPIILSSGFHNEQVIIDKIVVELLSKPYEPEVLWRAVRQALDGKTTLL